MINLLSIRKIRLADSTAIEKYLIPGQILMENAARSCSEIILEQLGDDVENVLILCGSGNNGGDGFALARHLSDYFNVKVLLKGEEEKMSPETLLNFEILKKLEVEIIKFDSIAELIDAAEEADCIVESLIGVGAGENLHGNIIDILDFANEMPAYKVAIDVPAGLNADNGNAHESAFSADMTITMFAPKTGMFLKSGRDLCGDIHIASLGAPSGIIEELADTHIIEQFDFLEKLGVREKISSKFDYGRVVIVAGSKNFPGASALCSNAAVTAGAGLTELFSPRIHPSLLPDVIFHESTVNAEGGISGDMFDKICASVDKANTLAIGPGLGDSDETLGLAAKVIEKYKDSKAIVIDADALKAVPKVGKLTENCIITPHHGELAKLNGNDRLYIAENPLEAAMEAANKFNCTVVLKNVPTIITNGKKTYLNITGNPGLATGGSGDVLTGIITAYAAQGLSVLDSAICGAYIHGVAADKYCEDFPEETLTAGKIIEEIKNSY